MGRRLMCVVELPRNGFERVARPQTVEPDIVDIVEPLPAGAAPIRCAEVVVDDRCDARDEFICRYRGDRFEL